ncbi:MAG: macrolide ABC transporter ATP-binding protein [Candidatus Margulisbacteria bacterium GWF2_35_9]|nr:MAG: macrolide ABC transporter ATP-binding protein [Candidatus Margulisbacteria bacterium GWF2_35_9]
MSFLKINNVSKTYKQGKSIETQALSNVSLEITEGDFIVISGPSGSGKTTLLNIIGGLDVPSSGTVELNGELMSSLPEKKLSQVRLNNIGFIFQAYNLVPVLTAAENIEYIMMLQKVDPKIRRERVKEITRHLGIEELLNKKPLEMSGGQQQRVAVARAIVSKPKLILADEPTANLDSENSDILIDLMKRLNEEEKVTFIFSTHDPVLMKKAKRNIVLKDGKIAE